MVNELNGDTLELNHSMLLLEKCYGKKQFGYFVGSLSFFRLALGICVIWSFAILLLLILFNVGTIGALF